MIDFRCKKCKKLLFMFDDSGVEVPEEGPGPQVAIFHDGNIEIKCTKCGYVNKISATINFGKFAYGRSVN